jgi:Uncharacterized protein conserved in bacteria (DUF2130)
MGGNQLPKRHLFLSSAKTSADAARTSHSSSNTSIWSTTLGRSPRCALPVAVALRQSLIELSNSRFVQQVQETKIEEIYQYLTGMKFRQRVEAVIEKFNDMRDDLDRERKFMGKQWSMREAQILAVVGSTVGMVGDLQGIAGKAMPGILGLDMPLLEESTDPEVKVSCLVDVENGTLPQRPPGTAEPPSHSLSWVMLLVSSALLRTPTSRRGQAQIGH